MILRLPISSLAPLLLALILPSARGTDAPNSTLDPKAAAAKPPLRATATPPLPALRPLGPLPASAPTTGVANISLDGAWELTGINPEGEKKIRIPARVPGMVHPDLLRAGLIKDPFWRDQANESQWIEDWEWVYERDFEVPEKFPREWVVLRFEGLDTYATIRVNGETVGQTDNMFIPFEFEVGANLKPGKNHIEVAFRTVAKALAGKPYQKIPTLFDQTHQRTYARKIACTFGWDWVHRFVSYGIWRPVALTAYRDARVEDVFVRTTSLGEKPGVSDATLRVELAAAVRNGRAVEARWKLTDPAGKVAWSDTQPVKDGAASREFSVKNPRLWWPNGAGEAALYQLEVALADEAGNVVDRRTVQTAMRTVAVEQIPDTIGRSFTILVNGTRIFAKGGNWVPADPFPSEISREKYNLLVNQAKVANTNILRSWGGGIYEPDAFFEACARDGIMVTQDLLLACGEYPDTDPDFADALNREFTIAFRALRNHPALVFWAGGNELGAGNRPMENWSAKNLQRDLGGALAKQLDPSRPYFVSSPYGGDPNNSPTAGDFHTNAQFNRELRAPDLVDYRGHVDKVTGRYMSEYAASGGVPKRTALKFMTEKDLGDPDMWEFHVKRNPYASGRMTLFRVLEFDANLLYGVAAMGNDRWLRQLEQAQYDFVRWGMEAARRRKWECSGIQFWMYNDCWPAAGWALIDYWGAPKAGWYALKSGCAPVIVALEPGKQTFRWSVCNDKLEPVTAKLRLRVQPWTGPARWTKEIEVTVPANTSQVAFEIPKAEILGIAGLDSVLVADLTYPGGEDRSWYYQGFPHEMRLPPAHLDVKQVSRGDEGTITLTTDNYARVVTLEADVNFSDNYFEMMPGETRTITWKAIGKAPTGDIPVTWWNRPSAASASR